MLTPSEVVLLSELKHAPAFLLLERSGARDLVLRTPDAKLGYRALKRAHKGGYTEEAFRRALEALATNSARALELFKAVGKPSAAASENVWSILAGTELARQHQVLTQAAGEGRFTPRVIEESLERLQRVHGTSLDGKLAPPRLLSERSPEEDVSGERFPTFVHSQLDKDLNGGLRRREVGVLVAPTNHGKTTCLLRLGAEHALRKKRVFHLSFEIYRDQVRERVQQLIGKKPLPKTLYAEHYPSDELSVEDIMHLLDKVKDLDLVVLDHLDKLRFDKLDLVNAQGRAIDKLRGYAKRRQILIWTAAQADDPEPSKLYLERGDLYGSRQKYHNADLTLGLIHFPMRSLLTISVWKTRHGEAGRRYLTQANLAKLEFKDLK